MGEMTQNLNLSKPSFDDNLSPEPFNTNFDIIDKEIGDLKIDYVVAQGISGMWYYRKWASGIYECFGQTIGYTGTWRWWNNKPDWLIYSGNTIQVSYPITFVSPPLEFTSCSIYGIDCWLDKASGGNTTTKSANYWMTTNSNELPSGSLPYRVDIHVIGRWK